MFTKHATLALAAISTQAIKLRQEIVGGDPSTWAPMQELSVDLDDYMPIAGGEGTGTPMQELSVDLGLAQADAEWNDIDTMACLKQGDWCNWDAF